MDGKFLEKRRILACGEPSTSQLGTLGIQACMPQLGRLQSLVGHVSYAHRRSKAGGLEKYNLSRFYLRKMQS